MAKSKSEQIEELLEKGVANIYPSRKFLEERLDSGQKLKIYQGFDPTGNTLHMGSMVGILKLKQFQDLGHQVIILIGDFTAQIGDPTDKAAARKPLTKKQVLQNCKNYKTQIGKILDLKKDLNLRPDIIRFLILKTVRENTIAAKRFVRRDIRPRTPVAKKEGEDDVAVPFDKEEIDKEIDAMVAV